MSADAAAAVLGSIKPGQARAALTGMNLEQASHALSSMSPEAAASAVSAMTGDEIATMLKAMPIEEATHLLLAMTSGLAGAALSSKVLSHELSAVFLHAMSTGEVPNADDHQHLMSQVAKETRAKVCRS
jgi:Mg/Co/Ni transporter MgtE